jgi:DNA (cytosine-5)-methyltransferase 3A
MRVLSLFDGMSCGQLALKKSNIKVDKYYSSEIEKSPQNVTRKNFPNTIFLGDVRNIKPEDLGHIDLLIGGSPCTNFSFSGKRNGMTTKCKEEVLDLDKYLELKNENFEFEGQSYLFWEYMRILTELKKINPNIKFLLENVIMTKKWESVLSTAIGVEPILIDSTLLSAQTRKRLYWTNISNNIPQPKDKGIELKDILEKKDFTNKATILGRRLGEDGKRKDYDKSIPIVQCLEVRDINRNKSNCLTTVPKDNVLTSLDIGRHPDVYGKNLPYRYYTPMECERLQTVPDNYTEKGIDFNNKEVIISDSARRKMLGNGWTIEVISYIFNYLK